MQAKVDIKARTVDPLVFYLTGKKPAGVEETVKGLRPALFAAYHDLSELRYDFPLVLIEGKTAGAPVRSLSALVNDLLQKIAPPGIESEQLRKMILRIEREICSLVAAGETGLLSELWDKVAARLEQADESFGKSARISCAALDIDGAVVDCGAGLATALVEHLWSAVQEDKARSFRAAVGRLAVKLADILRADHMRSEAGRSAVSLQVTIGPAHQELFDFAVMSRMLPKSSPREALSKSRRQRVEQALSVLKGQRFFAPVAGQARLDRSAEPYSFRFVSCVEALAAYRARLPDLVELVKALSIAELEIDGAYIEVKHDAVFGSFDTSSLSAQDSALFPDYLVTLGGSGTSTDSSGLMEALSFGIPFKVLVNIGDLLEETPAGNGHFSLGLRGAQLASIATGLGEVFVLQSTSSNLYQMRERVLRGLSFDGPALFSVFAGAPAQDGSLPVYLGAAAAMQARAFPAFSYDPSAGADMASRFSLENNPQPDADWTTHNIEYANADMQRMQQDLAFTFVDFLVSDPRYQHHFAAVPRSELSERTVPAAQWLAGKSASSDVVPYVMAVDDDNRLVPVVADEKAIAAARRCLETWHRLQELGGVHNSYAERMLKREKAAWEEQKRQELESLKPAAAPATTPAAATTSAQPAVTTAPAQAAAAPAPAPEAKAPERSPDEAYIETERCSTCNECTQINDRMFVYNADKQAYIADINAGTYRQLVEAAESCQLGIIHPGKPRNKDEPDLDELMKRAETFL